MSILLAIALQTAVGSPMRTDAPKAKVGRQVGQRIKGAPAPALKPSPAGSALASEEAEDASVSPKVDTAPTLTVGDTVPLDLKGTTLEKSIYGMTPPTFNESTWYYVVGGQDVPFRF